jgi:hypothetical protein
MTLTQLKVPLFPLDIAIQHLDVLIEASRLSLSIIHNINAHASAVHSRVSGPILPAQFSAQTQFEFK